MKYHKSRTVSVYFSFTVVAAALLAGCMQNNAVETSAERTASAAGISTAQIDGGIHPSSSATKNTKSTALVDVDSSSNADHIDYTEAAPELSGSRCAPRGIFDSATYGTEVVTWWNSNCDTVSCSGRIIVEKENLVERGEGTCEKDGTRTAFFGMYRPSSDLNTD